MASRRSSTTIQKAQWKGNSNIIGTMLPEQWKRVLLLNCKASPSKKLAGGSSLEHYSILDDDGNDEYPFLESKVASASRAASADPDGRFFVPQWNNSSVEDGETVFCESSDEDTQTTVDDVANMTGAFPRMENVKGMIAPPSLDDDLIFVTSIKGIDPCSGEIFSPKRRVDGIDSNAAFAAAEVDSETEEETSSSSGSSTAEDFVGARDLFSFEDCGKRRSIRFSDEIAGQQLTTIHLVPWTEHDDANWIPRPVRCRIEL